MISFKILLTFILLTYGLRAQDSVITIPENMITEGVPLLSVDIAVEVQNYTESRSSSFVVLASCKQGDANINPF